MTYSKIVTFIYPYFQKRQKDGNKNSLKQLRIKGVKLGRQIHLGQKYHSSYETGLCEGTQAFLRNTGDL